MAAATVREPGARSGTRRGRDQRRSLGNASDRTGVIGALSTRKKYGARSEKLWKSRVLDGAATELSCATLRAASASLGGAAGAVPPPHPAPSRGRIAVHASLALLGSRHMAASGAVAGGPQEWDQRERVLNGTGGGAGAPQGLHALAPVVLTPLIPSPFGRGETQSVRRSPSPRMRRGGQGVRTGARNARKRRTCGSSPPSPKQVLRACGSFRSAGPSHLWESRSFAPAALRMTSSLAS